MPAHPRLSSEHEKILWDKRELNMDTSKGLSRTVIFYLIKCFAMWQGKELRQLETGHVTFGEDDLGLYVAINFESISSVMKQKRKMAKRYDDPANPRSVYKIFKKYRSYVANEGPFLVRPISSIKDFICYSPLPLGVGVIESAVSTLMKDAGIGPSYVNYSVNLQSVEILFRFGTGSHCLAWWVFKRGLKGMPPAPVCGPTNCEDFNPEISLMMSRLLDAPHPFDAVDIIQKLELQEEIDLKKSQEEYFNSWMSNLTTGTNTDDSNSEKTGDDLNINTASKEKESIPLGGLNDEVKKRSKKKSSTHTSNNQDSKSNHSLLSEEEKEDNELRISSISSISESAFILQADEADVEKNSSATVNKKRKNVPGNGLSCAIKRRKSCANKNNTADKNNTDSYASMGVSTSQKENASSISSSEEEMLDDSADNCSSPTVKTEMIESGSEMSETLACQDEKTNVDSINGSCEFNLVEVKKEIMDDSDMELEERKDEPWLPRKHLIDPNCKKIDNFNCRELEDGASSSATIKLSNRDAPNLSVQVECTLSTTNKHIKLDKQHVKNCHTSDNCLSSSFCQQQLRDSIVPLKSLGHSVLSEEEREINKEKNFGNVESAPKYSCKEKTVNSSFHKDKSQLAICEKDDIRFESELDDSSEDEHHSKEFTIDLSPPVLSPQIPFPCDDEETLFENASDDADTNNLEVIKSDYSSTNNQSDSKGISSLFSSSSSSSSNVMKFLDSAHQQIKSLLKPTNVGSQQDEQNVNKKLSNPVLAPIPEICIRKKLNNSLSDLRTSDSTAERETCSSVTDPLKINNGNGSTATLSPSTNNSAFSTHSTLSIPTSNVQMKQQFSLLRSVLENCAQYNNVCVKSSSSTSSSSSHSTSNSNTSLLPIIVLENAPSDSQSSQIQPQSQGQEISNSKRNSNILCGSSHQSNSANTLVTKDSTSISCTPQLPVKIIVNNSSALLQPSSSSLLSTSQPSSSDSHNPISSVFNALSSSVLSTPISTSSSSVVIDATTSCHPCKTPTTIGSSSTPNGTNSAIFHAKEDRTINTLFQTLQVAKPEIEGGVETFNFADVPNVVARSVNKVNNSDSNSNNNKERKYRTSAVNLGDYFPPGTLIPASSIQIVTEQGENGSEVVMKFGFSRSDMS